MIVFLGNGCELSILLEWIPRLGEAAVEQLNKWQKSSLGNYRRRYIDRKFIIVKKC